MVVWDPALVISLLSQRLSCDSWSISTNNRDLILDIDCLLASSGRTLGALATFSTFASLREERFDPGSVNEVESTTGDCEEEEIEEDAIVLLV